ncbi:MAG: VanZ family protein, partial [Planctomycetota bacterium]|nr:VanZ family protein [Planctomycetota bacterium]
MRNKLNIIPLIIYWPAIFVLTHIRIPQSVQQAHVSDKTLHILAFMVLVFLLWLAVSPAKKVNWKKPAVWWIIAAAVVYGLLDEWLQIYVGRQPDMMDFFANLTGAFAGLVLLTVLDFLPASLIATPAVIFAATTVAKTNLTEVMPAVYTTFHFFAYALFTLLWDQSLRRKNLAVNPFRLKWFFRVSVLPVVLLGIVKVFSWLTGRAIDTGDIAAA